MGAGITMQSICSIARNREVIFPLLCHYLDDTDDDLLLDDCHSDDTSVVNSTSFIVEAFWRQRGEGSVLWPIIKIHLKLENDQKSKPWMVPYMRGRFSLKF